MRSAHSSATGDSRSFEAPASRGASGDLFVYGTLLLPAVIEALLGRIPPRLPATLHGYRRYRVTGKVYPAIAIEPEGHVDGIVYRDLHHAERVLLDAFESDIYVRRRVQTQTRADRVAADAYVLDDDHAGLLERAPAWSLEEFTAQSSAYYVRMCTEFRTRWGPTDR